MPFATNLLSQYHKHQLSIFIYSGILAVAGLVMDLMWWYATTHNLVEEDIDSDFVAFVHQRNRLAPIIYLLSIAISLFSITVAKFLIFVVAFLYIVPNPLDGHHHKVLTKRLEE
jgi:uncharacterized membrane protein